MKATLQIIAGILLIAIGLVLGFIIVVDFAWKTVGWNLIFLMAYIGVMVQGIVLVLDGRGDFPEYLNN